MPKAEAGGSQIQGLSDLWGELKGSLDSMFHPDLRAKQTYVFVGIYITICIKHRGLCYATEAHRISFSYWDHLVIYNLLSSDCVCTSGHQGTMTSSLCFLFSDGARCLERHGGTHIESIF